MGKKVELKSPHSTPLGKLAHAIPPFQKCGNLDTSKPQPHPTMWLRWGPGCCRPSNPWAVGPNNLLSPAPTCRVGLTFSSPLMFPLTLSWEGLRVQWGARSNLRCKVCGVPAVQWRPWTRVASPGNPGRGDQCSPLPYQVRSSSGGSHFWGVGPTPTVLFLDQASLPVFFFWGCGEKSGAKELETPHPQVTQHMPSPPHKNLGISMLPTLTSPSHVAEAGARVSSP